MAQRALERIRSAQLENQCKGSPVLALGLKYPINGGRGSNDGVVIVSYGLVCDTSSRLGDIKQLINEFEFFFRHYSKFERYSSKYKPTLNMLLANLRRAHLEGSGLSIPTGKRSTSFNNPERIGYALVNNALNYLSDKGLIELVKGKPGKDLEQRTPTVCWPKAELIAWFEINRIRPLLHDRAELVELRHKSISYQQVQNKAATKRIKVINNHAVAIPRKDRKKAEQLARPVRIYNEVWLNHTPTLEGCYLLPWTRRIFNESLDYGGRFYGSFQQLPKAQRAKILIDGFSTVEPDFSGYHINLLYTWEGLQLEGDPYDIAGYDRGLIKAVMLPLLNSESLGQLAGQITKSARPDMHEANARWQQKQAIYTQRRAFGQLSIRPEKPDYLKGFIEGIPEGTKGAEVIEAIKQKHPRIAHHFGSKNIGVRLQKQDSEIMAAVLCKLALNGIPALPVHDSIRVKAINEIHATEIMRSEYNRITGFNIKVE